VPPVRNTATRGCGRAALRGSDGPRVCELLCEHGIVGDDLDAIQDSTLANISTRGFIQTDNNVMIGGLIYLGGPGLTKVVVRGIGPSLAAQNIANALKDPVLELKDANGATVEANDNWAQSSQAAAIQAAGLQPSDPAECAIMRTGLPLGSYTAILKGVNGTGVGVVEVYIFQ